MIKAFVLVALGGAIGASSRFGLHLAMTAWLNKPGYWATLIVNVLGCFVMGLAFSWVHQKYPATNEEMRLFLTVGLLGALTTWSTFSMETVQFVNAGQYTSAVLYFLTTSALCLLAFIIGTKLMHTPMLSP